MDLVRTETIRAKGFAGGYQKAVMPSGLTVLLYPTEGLSTAHCLLGCKVGSQDCAFFDGEEEVHIPAGVAHFLEHKLFESEEGDLFWKFAKTGASANAYTSFDRTCYLFTATQNVAQSVDILLGQIGAPYLTDENVEKEKGIIAQEIMMYDDDPDWKGFSTFLEAMYHLNPVRIDIAGSVESISHITKEMLYQCYNSFYQPSNLSLFIVGDVDPTGTIDWLNSFANELSFPSPSKVTKVSLKEPDGVKEERTSIKMSVSLPQLYLGYKVNDSYMCGKDLLRTYMVSQMLMELFIGKGSKLYESLYADGIIDGSFDWQSEVEKKFSFLLMAGRTTDVDELERRLTEGVDDLLENGVDREDFDRVKRQIMGAFIRGFNSLEYITYNFLSYKLRGVSLLNSLEVANSISAEEVDAFAREVMREDRKVVSTVMPA